MEGNIIKLLKNVGKYLYDPRVGRNLLNTSSKAHTTKVQFEGCDKTKIKYFLVRGEVH